MRSNTKGLVINFLKVGLRSLHRYRQYSLINLLGLVIGLSSVFCIALYVHGELEVDRHHVKGKDIYRVNVFYIRPNGETRYPLIPPAFAPAAMANFPQVKNAARVRYAYDVLMKSGEKAFYEDRVFFAEPSMMEMFTFHTIRGDVRQTLSAPNQIVLTESMAKKYFGDRDPLGQVIDYNEELSLVVGAVVEDLPQATHFPFDFLIAFQSYQPGPGSLADLTSWRWLGFLSYLELEEGASIKDMEEQMAAMYISNRTTTSNYEIFIDLQPLYDIYLKSGDLSNPMGGLFRINSYRNIISLTIVALLTIVIAFFNYLNIITALMRTRTKEIGVRKVFGTTKSWIVLQLMSETFLLILIAGTISLAIIFCSQLLGYLDLLSWQRGLGLLTLTIAMGLAFSLIAGLYLGLMFSRFSAMALLQNKMAARGAKFSFRHLVLFVQYMISASLVAISLIVVSQMQFFSQKELGYDTGGVLVAPFRGNNIQPKIGPLRHALMQHPSVSQVSFGPAMDGSSSGSPLRLQRWPEDQTIQTAYFGVDFHYTQLMDLELLQGRFFSKAIQQDSAGSIMINESLRERIGLENPVGEKVVFAGGQEYEIIGVYSDFHYQSLHHEIGPMALMISQIAHRNMLIRVDAQDVSGTLAVITSTWNTIFPSNEYPLQYQFLESQLANMYSGEQEFSSLIRVFTGLAIFVALLGLFGLSSITIHLKLKQISIRRVLGAKTMDILGLIGQRFFLLALLASLASWPVVEYLMNRWLENFAYGIEIHYGFLLQMFTLVATITLLTLIVQVRRVVVTNPSRILKEE